MHPQPPSEAAGKLAYPSACLRRTLSHPAPFSPYLGHFLHYLLQGPHEDEGRETDYTPGSCIFSLAFPSEWSFLLSQVYKEPSLRFCSTDWWATCQLPAQPGAKRPLQWAGDSANCMFPIHVWGAFCGPLGSKEADGNSHVKPCAPGLAGSENSMWIAGALLRLCCPC